jgi:hypothetical protein
MGLGRGAVVNQPECFFCVIAMAAPARRNRCYILKSLMFCCSSCPVRTQPLRNLLVELCLLLPAQLRVLVELVLLPRLVVPLALALSGPDELVAQGLRTAEYWVDNLNPEYLEKALANVMGQVMGALWGLLKPNTTMRLHAIAAMQLLGKLGEASCWGLGCMGTARRRGSQVRRAAPSRAQPHLQLCQYIRVREDACTRGSVLGVLALTWCVRLRRFCV